MPTIYQRLLALYPETHRQRFGEEMMAVFEDVRADIWDKGALARAVFCVREIAGSGLPRRLSSRRSVPGRAILAIRKGEAIAYSLPHVNPQLPPIQPVSSVFLSGIGLMFMFFYAAGLVGWAILFAMRRSGVHRLAEMSGERK